MNSNGFNIKKGGFNMKMLKIIKIGMMIIGGDTV